MRGGTGRVVNLRATATVSPCHCLACCAWSCPGRCRLATGKCLDQQRLAQPSCCAAAALRPLCTGAVQSRIPASHPTTCITGAGGVAPVGNAVAGGVPQQRPSLAAIRPNLHAAQNAAAASASGGAGGGSNGGAAAGGGGRHWAGYHGELPTPRTPGHFNFRFLKQYHILPLSSCIGCLAGRLVYSATAAALASASEHDLRHEAQFAVR
jgi:hypothetical protein